MKIKVGVQRECSGKVSMMDNGNANSDDALQYDGWDFFERSHCFNNERKILNFLSK